MARRRHRLAKLGPRALARAVIRDYVNAARVHVREWADRYATNLRQAVNDEVKMTLAAAKLAAVYLAMIRRNVPVEYKRLYAEARNAHYAAVRGIYERIIGPAV